VINDVRVILFLKIREVFGMKKKVTVALVICWFIFSGFSRAMKNNDHKKQNSWFSFFFVKRVENESCSQINKKEDNVFQLASFVEEKVPKDVILQIKKFLGAGNLDDFDFRYYGGKVRCKSSEELWWEEKEIKSISQCFWYAFYVTGILSGTNPGAIPVDEFEIYQRIHSLDCSVRNLQESKKRVRNDYEKFQKSSETWENIEHLAIFLTGNEQNSHDALRERYKEQKKAADRVMYNQMNGLDMQILGVENKKRVLTEFVAIKLPLIKYHLGSKNFHARFSSVLNNSD
jgi:hypothetical protein